MVQALMSSVASLQAQQTQMDVIGNNLANINTVAFKGQDLNFSDLIDQVYQGATAPTKSTGGTDGEQVGLGVKVAGTTTDWSQGSLTATSVPSDMAIQGNGFFMVSNGSAISYTRDGNFELDASGDLVNADSGQELIGWSANSSGTVDTTQPLTSASTINIPMGTLSKAQATSTVTVGGNLDSAAASTETDDVTTTVYDSLGNPHQITIQFSNPTSPPPSTPTPPTGATSSWNWTAYSGTSATGTPIGSSSTSGNAPIYFNASGQQLSGLATGTLNQIVVPASGNAPATTIGVDMSSMQQLAGTSQVSVTDQNGFPPGSLDGYQIGTNGVITGEFSNGLTETLGQVALATFTNPGGLQNVGGNTYTTSANSGSPLVGEANSGTFGSINSGYLEQSNVDLSTNLTNLIVTQRGFEANTKIVSTVDQMLQDVLQMKQG